MPAPDRSHPPVPPVSRRSAPVFGTPERHRELASAFAGQGEDYDRLRPGYPAPVIDAILDAVPAVDTARPRYSTSPDPSTLLSPAAMPLPSQERQQLPPARTTTTVADLGAGTGKLSRALADRGLDVIAIDPSASMLDAALAAHPGISPTRTDADGADGPGPARPRLRTLVGTAEATGLPDDSVDLVTAAQAWHWFDTEAASAEVTRILRPGGTLALVWNTLDVAIGWVHRYSRIMHAGDVLRDDFTPPTAAGLRIVERVVHRWEDPRPTPELIDLARTRSYVITASPERREKVLANLDWYVHEHLGHAPGSIVGIPYRTDLFLLRADV